MTDDNLLERKATKIIRNIEVELEELKDLLFTEELDSQTPAIDNIEAVLTDLKTFFRRHDILFDEMEDEQKTSRHHSRQTKPRK